jgi:predicted exporter
MTSYMQQSRERTPRRLLASNRGRICLWLIFIGLLGVTAAFRLPDGINFRSDMLALLPEVERQPRVAEASATFSKGFEQQIVFAVDFGNGAALNVQALSQYANELETRLSASALFLSISNPDEPGPDLADRSPADIAGSGEQNSWRGAKFQLLTPTMRQTIQSNPQAMIDATRRTLYGLMASAQPIDLEQDPLNLRGQYQASFIPPSIELLTPTTILTNTTGTPVLILPRRLSAGAFDLSSHDR